jgi:hypothetical protein
MSWSNHFDELIELPDGRKLRSLKEAIARPAKEISSFAKRGDVGSGPPRVSCAASRQGRIPDRIALPVR